MDEFDLPYSYIEVAEAAKDICAYLDHNPADQWPGPGTPARYLFMSAALESSEFLDEWSKGRAPIDDPRAGAVIVVDVFPLADLWCPQHENQLNLFDL